MNADAIIGEVVKILAGDTAHSEKYDKLIEYAAYIAALAPLDQGRVRNSLAEAGWTKTDAKSFLDDCNKTLRLQTPTTKAIVTDRPHSWPYDIDGGRLVLLSEYAHNDGAVEVRSIPVADFTANISEEAITEEGRKIYTIVGDAIRSGAFSVDMDAEEFSDERKLKAALEATAGARDPVRAGMSRHLGPAIKLMTNGDLRHTRRFNRTGWHDDRFLIPGRTPEDITIRLSRKLPYGINPDASLEKALEALEALIQFMTPRVGSIVLSHLFLAPMAAHAGWRNERSGVFIKGRTGTHKSSAVQVAMCIYGPDFMQDDRLIKWGEGATRNAIMSYATSAHDLPFLVDNYKPTTGGGAHDFTNLIHNIMEGGDKERLNRHAQLRETKPLHTWPVFTGEDIPDNDPASIARILVLGFTKDQDLVQLTIAQELAPHLCAIGNAWISWLESEEGQIVCQEIGAELDSCRRGWFKILSQCDAKSVNPMRTATNLATNWLTWVALSRHPVLGDFALKYQADQGEGLNSLAADMARFTKQSLEAVRFIEALREVLISGRVVLLSDRAMPLDSVISADRDRIIGWNDGNDGAYLLPDITIALLQRTTGLDLGGISKQNLYDQLAELGHIASTDKNRTAKVVKVAGKTQRVLHLTPDAIVVSANEPAGEAQT